MYLFEPYFLALENVLDNQNNTKEVLSYITNLLTPFWDQKNKVIWMGIDLKPEVPHVKYMENQTIVFLTTKIETFTTVY